MKKTLRVLLAVVACAFVTAVGYFWGRRDGMLAEEKSLLIQSSLTAQLIRENHSDLVLQMAEQQMDYVALGLKRAGRVPDPAVICGDATTRGFYQNRPFWRASEYINHYPHPNVSASAIAYIQAQPESKN